MTHESTNEPMATEEPRDEAELLDSPQSPINTIERVPTPRPKPKRLQFNRLPSNFKEARKKNYSNAAFNRLRNRIGCKSAKRDTRVIWAALYQASIDNLLEAAQLIAESGGKKTITKAMVDHAYTVRMNPNRRLYSIE